MNEPYCPPWNKVRIVESRVGKPEIFVDDVLVKGVSAYRVEGGIDCLAEVTLTFATAAAEIEVTPAQVTREDVAP